MLQMTNQMNFSSSMQRNEMFSMLGKTTHQPIDANLSSHQSPQSHPLIHRYYRRVDCRDRINRRKSIAASIATRRIHRSTDATPSTHPICIRINRPKLIIKIDRRIGHHSHMIQSSILCAG
jgi:hypothetical protein